MMMMKETFKERTVFYMASSSHGLQKAPCKLKVSNQEHAAQHLPAKLWRALDHLSFDEARRRHDETATGH
jgi:hypothetical protein